MLKMKITAKQFGRLTPEKLVTKIALEQAGHEANKTIEARVTGPNTDANGRALAPKRVKEYRRRDLWVKAKDVRIIAEVRTPKREEIGRVKEAREDKRFGGAAEFTGSSVPPVIFQQMRQLGGVFRSIDAYEAQKLKGGTPVEVKRDQSWRGRFWSQGDVWGFHWPSREAFLSAQGKGTQVKLGGAGSRIWQDATVKTAIRANGQAFLTLGFRGAYPKGSAVQALDQSRGLTPGGKQKKVNSATIAAIANTRAEDGTIGQPSQTGGKPEGGHADLTEHGKSVQRWHALSTAELNKTIIPALATGVRDAIRKAPITVVLIEKGAKRKVK